MNEAAASRTIKGKEQAEPLEAQVMNIFMESQFILRAGRERPDLGTDLADRFDEDSVSLLHELARSAHIESANDRLNALLGGKAIKATTRKGSGIAIFHTQGFLESSTIHNAVSVKGDFYEADVARGVITLIPYSSNHWRDVKEWYVSLMGDQTDPSKSQQTADIEIL